MPSCASSLCAEEVGGIRRLYDRKTVPEPWYRNYLALSAEVFHHNKIHARFPQQMVAIGRDPLLSSTSLTFDALPPSLHVLLEAERVVVAELSAEVVFVHFEVDNSEHRGLFVSTNIVWYASSSSSVGVFD